MPRVTAINCVIFLLCQVYFSTWINGILPLTQFCCDKQCDRLKNDSMTHLCWQFTFKQNNMAQDYILNGMIKHNGNEIHLKWKKTDQLLANEHLPLWITKYEPYDNVVTHILKPNFIKENIGEFVMYHDVEKSSAVVYFKRTQTLSGFIDTRYTINNLPLSEINHGHSDGSQYVNLNRNPFPAHTKPDDYKNNYNKKEESGEPSLKRPHLDNEYNAPETITLYPEILVLVPSRVVDIAKRAQPDYMVGIITNHIIYFNAVDMLYAKLAAEGIKIHINIAGIVIDNNKVLPMQQYVSMTSKPSSTVNVQQTLRYTQSYLNGHKEIFVADSFDFFFTSTYDEMMTDEIPYLGLSQSSDIYKARLKPSTGLPPGFMVQRGLASYDFTTAAHEIGHLLDIAHDGDDEGFSDNLMRCSSVMQCSGGACPDCLRWSDTSIEYLRKYIKHSRDRCFLLNRPRSLHPHGQPMTTLLPSDQCRCYGFNSYIPQIQNKHIFGAVSPTDCNRNMNCGQKSDGDQVPSPIDGTPCDTGKVCWNKICQYIHGIHGRP